MTMSQHVIQQTAMVMACNAVMVMTQKDCMQIAGPRVSSCSKGLRGTRRLSVAQSQKVM
jgi:hypothetical protein